VTLREAAHAYLDAGLRPIACEPRAKRAIVSWKEFQQRAPTHEEIDHWWTMWPDANIALVLGQGLMAVDLDSFDARENLERAGVVLPSDAPVVATGKGAHVYLSGTSGDRVGLVPGVDIRGVGYVVAPPSIHPSGRAYVWVNDFKMPPPAPPSLLALLGRSSAEAPSVPVGDWFSEAMGGISEGGRDALCTRMAGYLLGKGVSVEASEAILLAWAARCTPPFPADQVTKCVDSIAKRESYDSPGTLPSTAADLIEPTLALILRPVKNIRPTGLAVLDGLLEGGLEPGTVTLLGARPAVGKTAMALQIATHVASAGTGVLFVSLEMSATRLMRRVLCQLSQVRFANIKTGDLKDGEKAALQIAADRARTLPMWIESRVRTVEAVDAIVAELGDQVGFVVVDYLQRMSAPESRLGLRESVEHVSKALGRVASRGLPILALSSLSRPDRADSRWRPSLTSLRESGALESDADSVILLHRDEGSVAMEVSVAKQRDGATGSTVLTFAGETLTVRGLA
jgi:KaiC/GvpD/RAD55 family RecA-like ATPase